MTATRTITALLLRIAFALAAGVACIPSLAAPPDDAMVLVATRALQDPIYGETVLIVKPLESGEHVGLILNRPTRFTLADLFPDDEPSQRVHDPVYMGGPSSVNIVVALVAGHVDADNGSIAIAPYISLAVAGDSVDHIIQTASDQARFFVGAVIWRPGELDEELKAGAWHVMSLEPQVVFEKDTAALWPQLVERAERQKGATTVQAAAE